MNYKGYNLTPKFCDPNQKWGTYKDWFHIGLPNRTIFNQTYQGCIDEAQKHIDNYLKINVDTTDTIITEISSCFLRADYDGIDIDETKLRLILSIIMKK